MGFNLHGCCRLAAICESLDCENLDINGYAQYNGWPDGDIAHRKMVLIILRCRQTPFSHLASSFATVSLVLGGCGVCIPSFSVPNCGSMSDLVKVAPHSMATGASKARMCKGAR